MRRLIVRLFLLMLFLTGSLASPILLADRVAAADERDAEAQEWEEQVATDARGDVPYQWPGTTDLLYLTMGEVYTFALRETYLFMRIGYNMTDPEDADLDNEPITPPDPVPPPAPLLPRDDPEVAIVIGFRANGVDHNITLYRFSLQEGPWRSNAGQLIMERPSEDTGHDELLFFTPIRRWGIQPGDIIDNITAAGYRDGQETDRMEGFDVGGEYPWPFGETLQPGPQGVPEGIPKPGEYVDWLREERPRFDPMNPRLPDPDRDIPEDPPEPDVEKVLEDPESGKAHRVRHEVQSGQERLIVRWDKEVVEADFSRVGQVNFTVENLFDETPQTVVMLASYDRATRWLMAYAPGTEPVQVVQPGETARFSVIAAPFDFAATPFVDVTFIFLSDWGGYEIRLVRFVNTAEIDLSGPDRDPRGRIGYLPPSIGVDILNKDDHFRVNEPRLVMIRVSDETGRPYSGFKEVRAFIHPIDERPPEQPYQLNLKYFTEGVYEVPFTFDKPGAWVVDVYFYDYQPGQDGYPHIDFFLRVDYPGESRPVVPTPLAIGGLGLGLTALAVNERLTKKR